MMLRIQLRNPEINSTLQIIKREKVILKENNISKFYRFYCVFDTFKTLSKQLLKIKHNPLNNSNNVHHLNP